MCVSDATILQPGSDLGPACLASHRTAGGKLEAGGTSAAVSAAVQLALVVGCMQALVLGLLGPQGLAGWGAAPGSPLFSDAAAYLGARAMAAPATVLMLVLMGCFRQGTGLSWVVGDASKCNRAPALPPTVECMQLQRRCTCHA